MKGKTNMSAFIIIVVSIMYFILVGFTWYRLEAVEGTEKILYIGIGVFISWAITELLFLMSTNGMSYASIEMKEEVGKVLVLTFTPINGIVLMPYGAKLISHFKFDEEEKSKIMEKLFILIIIAIVLFIVETIYLKNIQLGIIKYIK